MNTLPKRTIEERLLLVGAEFRSRHFETTLLDNTHFLDDKTEVNCQKWESMIQAIGKHDGTAHPIESFGQILPIVGAQARTQLLLALRKVPSPGAPTLSSRAIQSKQIIK